MMCWLVLFGRVALIPEFDDNGNLPPGVHLASWKEIVRRFGTNERRRNLLGGLRFALQSLQNAGCQTVYLDGSFVTSKTNPGDYDGLWNSDGVTLDLLDPVLLDFTNKQANQKKNFGGELFPNLPTEQGELALFDLFQTDKVTGKKKGIVAINLEDFE
jgi:hypothetical protein